MKITRIDLTGKAGSFAIVTRKRDSQRIDVEVLTPKGNRTDSAMTRDYYAQQQLARRIQSALDGHEGTEGNIAEYLRIIQMFAD